MANLLMTEMLKDCKQFEALKSDLIHIVELIANEQEVTISASSNPHLDFIVRKIYEMQQELNHYKATVKSSSC